MFLLLEQQQLLFLNNHFGPRMVRKGGNVQNDQPFSLFQVYSFKNAKKIRRGRNNMGGGLIYCIISVEPKQLQTDA